MYYLFSKKSLTLDCLSYSIIFNNLMIKAMTKKSNLFKHFRELMVGENQCDLVDEWASELPNRKYETVGFGDYVPPLPGTDRKLCCFLLLK